MRDAFSDTLVRLAKTDRSVLLLTGDHGYALFDAFRRECPDQYINAGIAEQNMVGMAAGLARAGFRPFVYGLSAFIPIRVVEQIKLDVAHDDLPVIFIGDGAGFVYSHLGTSHQSTEDLACTRAIPGLAILSPADRHEVASAMQAAYDRKGPVYFRMGKADRGDVHPHPVDLPVGAPLPVRKGASGVSFLATGSMVSAANRLAENPAFDASVWSVPWIKPADADAIAAICESSRAVVVLEEHSIYGGLGSLVTEISCNCRAPKPVLRLGVADRFSDACGSYNYLLREHGLDDVTLEHSITDFLRGL